MPHCVSQEPAVVGQRLGRGEAGLLIWCALSQHRSWRTPKCRHHPRFACMRQRACMRLQGSSSTFALSTSRVTANPPASCASQTAARPFLQPHACVHTLHCAPVRRRSRAWKPARSALTCCGARRYVSYASAYEALAARDAIDGRSHSMRIAPLRTCRRRARMAWRLRWPLSFVCFCVSLWDSECGCARRHLARVRIQMIRAGVRSRTVQAAVGHGAAAQGGTWII